MDTFTQEEKIDLNPQINTLSIYQSAQSKHALIPQIPYSPRVKADSFADALLSQSCKVKLWAPYPPAPAGN